MPADAHAFVAENKDKEIDGESKGRRWLSVQPSWSRCATEHSTESDCFWTRTTTNSSTLPSPAPNPLELPKMETRRSRWARRWVLSLKGADAKARFFAECRILQRPVKVRLLSAPVSLGSSPFQAGPTPSGASKANGSGLPSLPSAGGGGAGVIIGTV